MRCATRLEAIATRLEVIVTRLEAMPSLLDASSRNTVKGLAKEVAKVL